MSVDVCIVQARIFVAVTASTAYRAFFGSLFFSYVLQCILVLNLGD